MKYMLIMRLWDKTYITYHAALSDLQREISLVEAENGFQLNYIDPTLFNEECDFSRYPNGSALSIKFTLAVGNQEKATYISPFSGKRV